MAEQMIRECDIHLVPILNREGCHYCLRFLAEAPDPEQISTAARLDELERWLLAEPSVPAALLRQRIEQLVGRPVASYELDDPDTLMRRAQRPRRRFDYWDDTP